MDTREIVTSVKEDFAPDWSTEKILSYLDRCQKNLFSIDCPLTTFFSEGDTSFPLPILSTISGELTYSVIENNLVDSTGAVVQLTKNGYDVTIRKVKNVHVQKTTSSLNNRFFGEQFEWAGMLGSWTNRLTTLSFYIQPAITIPRTENEPAKIIFPEDPGTYDDRYYVECYYNPITLTSVDVPLSIDGNMWDEALIDGIVGLIEKSQYGRSEKYDIFQNYHKKKFRSYGTSGISNRSSLVMSTRECG